METLEMRDTSQLAVPAPSRQMSQEEAYSATIQMGGVGEQLAML